MPSIPSQVPEIAERYTPLITNAPDLLAAAVAKVVIGLILIGGACFLALSIWHLLPSGLNISVTSFGEAAPLAQVFFGFLALATLLPLGGFLTRFGAEESALYLGARSVVRSHRINPKQTN